jgi:hypothetical protein
MRSKRRKQKEVFYVELRTAGDVPLMLYPSVRKKITNGLRWSCDKRGLRIYDYSILPDRVLMIANVAWGSLDDVLSAYREFSSKAVMLILRRGIPSRNSAWIIPALQEFGPAGHPAGVMIWNEGPQVRSLFKQEDIDTKSDEILHAPVKLGLVRKAEDYLCSSSNPFHPLAGWVVEAFDPWS